MAATLTPMGPDGRINLDVVDKQARHLAALSLAGAFICGMAGENMSLRVSERKAIMGMLGLECEGLRRDLEELGFLKRSSEGWPWQSALF